MTPAKKEIEDHFPLHITYRSWCAHCVAGRGTSRQHRQNKDGDEGRLGTTIGIEYCFMTPEEEEEDMRPILVAHDDDKEAIWVIAIDRKGPTMTAVKWLVDKIDEAGYAGMKVTIKSDQEESIMALKRAVAVTREAETAFIETPVRQSKCNGKM